MAGLHSSQELNTMLEEIADRNAGAQEAAPGTPEPEPPLESLRVDIDLSHAAANPRKEVKKAA